MWNLYFACSSNSATVATLLRQVSAFHLFVAMQTCLFRTSKKKTVSGPNNSFLHCIVHASNRCSCPVHLRTGEARLQRRVGLPWSRIPMNKQWIVFFFLFSYIIIIYFVSTIRRAAVRVISYWWYFSIFFPTKLNKNKMIELVEEKKS